MIPTLAGRLQTRLLLFVLIGLPVTALFTLAWLGGWSSQIFDLLLSFLATITALGLVLDLAYIGLQHLRWDRDWPFAYQFFFSLLEFGIVLFAARAGLIPWLPAEAFSLPQVQVMALCHFASVFIPSFLALLGPISVLFLRWRFKAGQLGRM